MITLYMDNFRGFKDTYLPLKDVNFFVGENSTGKTSVMALLSLLSSYRFWETFDFSTDFFDLGLFSDITTQNKELTLGFFSDSFSKKNRKKDTSYRQETITPNALLISFTSNEDGTFKVSKFFGWYVETEIHFRIENNENFYFVNNFHYENSQEAFNSLLSKSRGFIEIDYQKMTKKHSTLFFNSTFSLSKFIFFVEDLYYNMYPKELLDGKKMSWFDLSLLMTKGISLLKQITWIAPIRSKPQRIYERTIKDFSPEGEHIPFLLKELSESGSQGKLIFEHLNSFGKSSGLFNNLAVKKYGDEKNSPFEIQVKIGDASHKITNVGYGVSQILPLVVDLLTRTGSEWFLLQQPEVHLHPKAQSAAGEFIFNQASEFEKKFIIETHSDFLVDRYRLNLRKSDKKVETQVVFFEQTENGNRIHLLQIDNEGRYPEDQPSGFSEFFVNEAIAMMEV